MLRVFLYESANLRIKYYCYLALDKIFSKTFKVGRNYNDLTKSSDASS